MKPDLRIHKIETTQYWRPDIVARAGKLFGVYIFDANRHVHAAELQPSYELNYIGPAWTNSPEDDEVREKLFSDVIEGDDGTAPILYNHVRNFPLDSTKPFPTSDKDWTDALENNEGDEEKAYNEVLTEAIEYCQCNGYCY